MQTAFFCRFIKLETIVANFCKILERGINREHMMLNFVEVS